MDADGIAFGSADRDFTARRKLEQPPLVPPEHCQLEPGLICESIRDCC
jgi:hypothetical protein